MDCAASGAAIYPPNRVRRVRGKLGLGRTFQFGPFGTFPPLSNDSSHNHLQQSTHAIVPTYRTIMKLIVRTRLPVVA